MKTSLFLTLIVLSTSGCFCCQRNALTKNQSQEMFYAVDKMLSATHHMSGRTGTEIPSEYWPQAVRELHPLDVYMHRSNVLIVTSRNSTEECGYCVMPTHSSYYPAIEQEGWICKPLGNLVFAYRKSLKKSGHSEQVSIDSPEFRAVEGRYFVLLKECYVFRYVGETNKYPLVGFVSETSPSIFGAPKDAMNYVGKCLNDIEILGVLPKETHCHPVKRY